MRGPIREAFNKGDTAEVIRLMDRHFGMNNYSLWHLFRDEQRKVSNLVLGSVLEGVEISFRKMYEKNYPMMSFLQSLKMPLPRPLSMAAEYIVNLDLKRIFEEEDLNLEKFEGLLKEARRWSIEIDKETIGFVATSWVSSIMERLQGQPEEVVLFEKVEKVLMFLSSLSVKLDLWKAQNACFSIAKTLYRPMQEKAERGEGLAKRCIELFHRLGDRLQVKVT
jgi:hypothetical protein